MQCQALIFFMTMDTLKNLGLEQIDNILFCPDIGPFGYFLFLNFKRKELSEWFEDNGSSRTVFH